MLYDTRDRYGRVIYTRFRFTGRLVVNFESLNLIGVFVVRIALYVHTRMDMDTRQLCAREGFFFFFQLFFDYIRITAAVLRPSTDLHNDAYRSGYGYAPNVIIGRRLSDSIRTRT